MHLAKGPIAPSGSLNMAEKVVNLEYNNKGPIILYKGGILPPSSLEST